MELLPKEFVKSFSEVQHKIKKIKETGRNPHFNSSFVELDYLADKTYPILESCGFSVTQPVVDSSVETWLIHSTGFVHRSKALIPYRGEDPQKWSSCVTYLRRVSLLALLGIAPSNCDDDAEAVVRQPTTPKPSGYSNQPTQSTVAVPSNGQAMGKSIPNKAPQTQKQAEDWTKQYEKPRGQR